jgi:hypothetical protein
MLACVGACVQVVTKLDATHVLVSMIPNKAFSVGHSPYSNTEEDANEPKKGVLSLFKVGGGCGWGRGRGRGRGKA